MKYSKKKLIFTEKILNIFKQGFSFKLASFLKFYNIFKSIYIHLVSIYVSGILKIETIDIIEQKINRIF